MASHKSRLVRRGDIFFIDLEPAIGSEQGKVRPSAIISHDNLNIYAEHIIAVPIASRKYDKVYASHVVLSLDDSITEGTIKVEHIRSISKLRLQKKIGTVSQKTLQKIGRALQHTCDYY